MNERDHGQNHDQPRHPVHEDDEGNAGSLDGDRLALVEELLRAQGEQLRALESRQDADVDVDDEREGGGETADTPEGAAATSTSGSLAADPSRWLSLPDAQRRELWKQLAEWVDSLAVTYDLHTESRLLPPCWWRHSIAAQELAALWQAHRSALSAKAPSSEAAHWHVYLLWPLVRRLSEQRVFASCTLTTHTMPSRSAYTVTVTPSATAAEFLTFLATGAPDGCEASDLDEPVIDITALDEIDEDAPGHGGQEDVAGAGGPRSRLRVEPVATRPAPTAALASLGQPTRPSRGPAPVAALTVRAPGTAPVRPLSELQLSRQMVAQMLAEGGAVAMLDDLGSPIRIHGTWWTTTWTPDPSRPPGAGATSGSEGAQPSWRAVADPEVNTQLDQMWQHQVAAGRGDEPRQRRRPRS